MSKSPSWIMMKLFMLVDIVAC